MILVFKKVRGSVSIKIDTTDVILNKGVVLSNVVHDHLKI